MSKKLISIFLCLVMFLMPLLVSCGGGEDSAETGDPAAESEEVRLPMTLTLWLPTDESTSPEAIKLVEQELNKLVQAKYETAIELHAISSDKYQQVIDDRIKEIDDVQKAAEEAAQKEKELLIEYAENCVLPEERDVDVAVSENDTEETDLEATAETEVDEYGQSVTVYPEVEDDQLDIFLVKGYDNYTRYVEEELIEDLTTDINGVGKKLYSCIYPTFFDLSKIDGMRYCVPNNHAIGEYQFLLVNKRLLAEYDYYPVDPETGEVIDTKELSKFDDCEEFLFDIGSQNLPGVTPLLGEVEAANMVYFSSDGKWSLIGAQIGAGVDYTTSIEPVNIIQNTTFRSTYVLNKKLKHAGYVGDGNIDEGEEFAVGVINGDASLIDQYSDDYFVYYHGVPVADVDDVLESAFCVSKYTKSTSRSMEVITYINTDEKVRTLLQYGVEGTHWEEDTVNGEKVLTVLKQDYKMNIVDTGNVYLTYPAPGVPMSYWENAKKQNLDSSVNPFIGFEYITDDNSSYFKQLETESAKVMELLESTSGDDIQTVAASLVRQTIQNPVVATLTLDEPGEEIADPIVYLYLEYMKSKR